MLSALSWYVTAKYLGRKTQHTIDCSNESKARQNPDESHFCIGLPHQLSEFYTAGLLIRLQILQHAWVNLEIRWHVYLDFSLTDKILWLRLNKNYIFNFLNLPDA